MMKWYLGDSKILWKPPCLLTIYGQRIQNAAQRLHWGMVSKSGYATIFIDSSRDPCGKSKGQVDFAYPYKQSGTFFKLGYEHFKNSNP